MDSLLGYRVKDRATGFEGVATARAEFLNGCVRYTVETVSEGKIVAESFDEIVLEQTSDRLIVVPWSNRFDPAKAPLREARTGGPNERAEGPLRER